jgi:predicted peptidase
MAQKGMAFMAYIKSSNVINIFDKKTEKKVKKKINILLEEYLASNVDDDMGRACVVETSDGAFHKTHLSYFDDRGLFCSKFSGHCEFFDYTTIKNIF